MMQPGAEGQYFSEHPAVATQIRQVDILLDGIDLTLDSDAGVFSHGQLDAATRFLIETVPMPDDGADILDLGCGYGAIAAVAARRGPSTKVVAVDVNERARNLTARNAQRSELTNIEVCSPSDVATNRAFDRIYSNPPIRIGKSALHALLLHWLARLRDDGIAYLVVGKYLGADSLATWLGGAGFAVERIAAKNSFRIISVMKEH